MLQIMNRQKGLNLFTVILDLDHVYILILFVYFKFVLFCSVFECQYLMLSTIVTKSQQDSVIILHLTLQQMILSTKGKHKSNHQAWGTHSYIFVPDPTSKVKRASVGIVHGCFAASVLLMRIQRHFLNFMSVSSGNDKKTVLPFIRLSYFSHFLLQLLKNLHPLNSL